MKVKRQRRKFKFKFVLFIIVSTCFLGPNYLGLRLSNAHGAEKDLNENKLFEYTNLKANSSISQSEKINENKSFSFAIPRSVILIMALIFAIAPLCSIIWLRFLHNQPLDKQCLVNHLFRDLVRTNTLFVCLLNILAFSFGIFEGSTLIFITKYLVLINEAIFFVIMVYLWLIASMRLYTIRFNVLDPVDEFLGEYSGVSHIFIRLLILITPIFATAILYSHSIQPIIYYHLVEKNMSWKDIPQTSRILHGIETTLCLISVTLFGSVKIYQWKVESKERTHNLGNGTGNDSEIMQNDNIPNAHNETEQESSTNPQESGERNLYDLGRMALPNLMYLLVGLLITVLILLQSWGVLTFDIWWTLTAVAGLQGVVLPTTIILWYDNLRMYCFRQIAYHINIIIPPTCGALCFNRMFNNAIRPIE